MAAVPHVVVITFPFASHAVKLFRLARALAAAAPAATFSFLSTAGSIAQLQEKNQDALEANLRFVEVPDGLLPPSSGGDGPAPPPNHMARLVLFLAAAEAGGVKVALETARASAGGARVTCVVGDAFVWMAAEAAAAVGAPWVPVWTGGPARSLRTSKVTLCATTSATKRRPARTSCSPRGLGSYRVRDLPDGCVFGDMHLPIVALFRRVAEQLHVPRAATAVALNTFPGLLPDDVTAALAAELPEVLPIGPFHLLPVPSDDDNAAAADPHGCLSWLDGHPARAVAYASFGTVVTAVVGGQEELRELAAGLEACGAPFLWSLPKEYWPLLPAGFLDLEHGKVLPWAPQAAVLRHASVGGFVTHAGWASVLEGVAGGVPMACRPFFSDQRMNARMVAHVWGFGTVFEQAMTRATVAAAMSSLLAGDQGTRMQEMRSMAATAFAADGGSRKNLDKLLKIVCCSPQEHSRDDHVHVDEAAEVTRCAPTTHDDLLLLGGSSLAHTVAD